MVGGKVMKNFFDLFFCFWGVVILEGGKEGGGRGGVRKRKGEMGRRNVLNLT